MLAENFCVSSNFKTNNILLVMFMKQGGSYSNKLVMTSSLIFFFPILGALMVVAWIGFATMAILVARYMKETWGTLCGKKAWFQVNVHGIPE